MSIDERVRQTLRRRADDVMVPDELWERIDDHARTASRDTSRRIAIAVAALVLALGSFAFVFRAFRVEPRPERPVADPTLWQVREFPVGRDPGELVIAQGSVWIARDGVVTRVDPSSGTTQDTPVALRSEGSSGTVSPRSQLTYGDGRIWTVAEPFFVGIDARSGEVERSFAWESGVTRLTFHEGRLFYGGSAEGNGQIVAIDPSNDESDSWGTAGAANPAVVITQHWLWAADSRSLTRVAPDRDPQQVVAGIDVVDSITAVGDAVWVTGDGTLWKVDAREPAVSASPQSEFPAVADGAVLLERAVTAQASVAAGGGALWLLEQAAAGTTLTQLDPTMGSPIGAAVALGYDVPAVLAVDERGAPWVTFRNEGVLVSLAPSEGAVLPENEPTTPVDATSARLEVSCEGSGVQLGGGSIVTATAEGVQVAINNPAGARYVEFHRIGSGAGSSIGAPAAAQRVFNWPIEPGGWLVGCIRSGQDYRDVPTRSFEVVDPTGYWIQPGLDCDAPTVEQARVYGDVSDEEVPAVALSEITGVTESDTFGGAGYGGRNFHGWRYWGIVVRDGKRVASLKVGFNREITIESCVADIHWVGP